MKKVKKVLAISLGISLTLSFTTMMNIHGQESSEKFNQRYQAEDFISSTGNIYVRNDGDKIPVDSPVIGAELVLSGADGGKYLDFSDPITKFASNNMYGEDYQLVDKNGGEPVESIKNDTATWKVTVPQSGFYRFSFKYNNPATRVKGYRNDRDERNCRIMINTPVSEGNTEEFYTDSNKWAGWMIFNISGYNDQYDANTNTSLTPQTDNNYANVIGNTKWNDNFMNIYLDEGENTVTLGIQAPPGQGVYDGPNLDYFDVSYVGDEYVSTDEIPYIDDDFKFEHPGIYFTMDDLETIKANKDDLDTVYGKGYQEMKASKYAKADYVPAPQSLMDVGPYNNPNYGGTQYTNDGCAAYYNALMWYLDGDLANAKKAIEILNGWATTLETVADGNDLKLRFSIVGPDYLNAAEILKHIYNNDPNIASEDKWQTADMAKFETFIQKLLAKTSEYYPQANGNWDALIGGFNMAAAVYLEDVDLFNDALRQMYLGNLQGGNTASMGSLPNYVYATGESQETSRDATHSRMGISGLAYQAEVAWNQGINLYSAYNDRLLVGAKYNAAYLLGDNVDSKTFVSDKNRLNSDISSMVFEIVSNHYLNQVDENQDVSILTKAAEQRLRTGGTKNEAKTNAMYYGAMIFTEAKTAVDLDVRADKTTFTKVGDTITLTPILTTDSKIRSLRTTISEELKPYITIQENENGTLSISLIQDPAKDISGDITISTVKNASVTKDITLSYKVPVITLDQSQITMLVGDRAKLNVLGVSEDTKIVWSTSNQEIVDVKDGELKALAVGEADVIAAIEGTEYQAKCHIIVNKKADTGNQSDDVSKQNSIKTGDEISCSEVMLLFFVTGLIAILLTKKYFIEKND
ncbi:alginate lyase family protein [Thomasclavelia saccharogumia]|uniref:alginate lyase family protein n=1 Tax=Thomasclavelia saccharogumia TaxID=341225 RepID=UPI00047E73CC|nr:alginate lyase family protein [Thomasclavelia saccharogumia]